MKEKAKHNKRKRGNCHVILFCLTKKAYSQPAILLQKMNSKDKRLLFKGKPKTFTVTFRANPSLFTVGVMEYWNRLPKEAVESPSMQIFKTYLDAYLCDLL